MYKCHVVIWIYVIFLDSLFHIILRNAIHVLLISDVEDPPFEPRNVKVRKDKWVTDEYDIQDFLGR